MPNSIDEESTFREIYVLQFWIEVNEVVGGLWKIYKNFVGYLYPCFDFHIINWQLAPLWINIKVLCVYTFVTIEFGRFSCVADCFWCVFAYSSRCRRNGRNVIRRITNPVHYIMIMYNYFWFGNYHLLMGARVELYHRCTDDHLNTLAFTKNKWRTESKHYYSDEETILSLA